MKLHLGCGQYYLEGYVNIDYPMQEHTVQQKSVADLQTDLLLLKYPENTIDEVRLHHVFEHFSRSVVCALLSNWRMWLKPGGRVHIEVPDFEKSAKAALSLLKKPNERFVALRHIFGSQEAHWAVHYEGYTKKTLTALLARFGYKAVSVKQSRYKATYNLEIVAERTKAELTVKDLTNAAEKWLSQYMVDDSDSEKTMLKAWMAIYLKHLN